jgi:hypothetical protein
MSNRIILGILLAALALSVGFTSRAATNVVAQGANFQQAINAASSGDTLVVQSGIYSGDLNFDRSLTVLCSGTQIQFTGNVTVTNTAAVSFSQCLFFGSLAATTNTAVIFSQTVCSNSLTLSGSSFQAFDSQFLTLAATGSKVVLKRCSGSGNISLNATAFEALRLNCTSPLGSSGSIIATAPIGSATRFVMTQSTITEYWWSVTGYEVYLGYNSIYGSGGFEPILLADYQTLVTLTDCSAFLVGNVLYQDGMANADGAPLVMLRGFLHAYNNRIHSDTGGSSGNPGTLTLLDSAGDIINNTFEMEGAVREGGSIGVANGNTGPVIVRANALHIHSGEGIFSGGLGQISECSYCCIGSDYTPLDHVTGVNCLITDPILDLSGYTTMQPPLSWLSPMSGSPCVHAGPPDAIYNNTDGTRNTIGYTGGPLWNPANYTNNNPLVFFLNTTNQTVIKGAQTNVQINLGASAGH